MKLLRPIQWFLAAFLICTASSSKTAFMQTPSQEDLGIASDVAWNADGTRLAVAYPRHSTIGVVDVKENHQTFYDLGFRFTSLSWNPNNDTQLAFSDADGEIGVLNLVTGELIYGFRYGEFVEQVAWSPNGAVLASVNQTGSGMVARVSVSLWKAATGEKVGSFANLPEGIFLAWNPQNHHQLAAAMLTGNVVIWDTQNLKSLVNLYVPDVHFNGIAWSFDGTQLALSGVDSSTYQPVIQIRDAMDGRELSSFAPDNLVNNLDWTPGGQLTYFDRDSIKFLDPAGERIVSALPVLAPINDMDWSVNSQLAIAYNGSYKRYDVLTPPIQVKTTPTSTSQ